MSKIKDVAIRTFRLESDAIIGLIDQLSDDFENAVYEVVKCPGKVIVTGMGKSGLIGSKIAATLASTGTPSFFMHPAEAYHGDLGMIAPTDIVLAISNSGQTDEILKLIPFFESNGNILISLTGEKSSTLAKHSKYHFNIAVEKEACPLSLAPTSSTTATLAMGDAFAIALMEARGFKSEDFARFHPGGSLGRRLLTSVKDVMHSDNLPCISKEVTLSEVIIEISRARMGIAVVTEQQKVVGLVTDGDVRRAMQRYERDFFEVTAETIMTKSPKTISENMGLIEAEELMLSYKIHSLLVTDSDQKLQGIVELYDLRPDVESNR